MHISESTILAIAASAIRLYVARLDRIKTKKAFVEYREAKSE